MTVEEPVGEPIDERGIEAMSVDAELDREARPGYHHGELPETLITLALQHIAEQGTEKLSLRALAREAGVSATAPYRHFPTKKCLLAAIATQGFQRLHRQITVASESDADVDDRFVAMGVAYINFAVENPISYKLMFGSVLGDFTEYESLHEAAVASYDQVQRMLQEVIDAHRLAYEVVQLGGVVWAGVHGVASLLLNDMNKSANAELASPMRSVAAMHRDPEAALRIMFASLLA